jgi:AraC family transcriptional regulator
VHFRFAYLRPTPVLYFGVTGSYEESAQQAWEGMLGWFGARRLGLDSPRGFGIFCEEETSREAQLYRYDACLELKPGLSADPSNGIVRRVTPHGAYALARLKGSHQQMGENFRRIREQWAQSDSIVIDPERPYMEIYLNDPATTPPDDLLTQLCVPVWLPIRVGKRRRAVQMIRV